MNSKVLFAKSLAVIALTIGLAIVALQPMPATAAGPATLPELTISLTSDGIMVSPAAAVGGDYLLTITNNTETPRGVQILGIDKESSPTVRYTAVLQPGSSQTFRWYLASGKAARIRDLLSCTHDQRNCLAATFGLMSTSIDVM